MTWTQPKNFTDNTIITANDWNTILGANGSLYALTQMILSRGSCNIFKTSVSGTSYRTLASAGGSPQRMAFNTTGSVYITSAGKFDFVTPGYFSIPSTSKRSGYWPVDNKNRSNVNQIVDGVPFIVSCYFLLATTDQTTISNTFRVRATIEREYRTGLSNGANTMINKETIGAQYFNCTLNEGFESQILSFSLCYVSHNVTDRYYLTIDHSLNKDMYVAGSLSLHVNPGAV